MCVLNPQVSIIQHKGFISRVSAFKISILILSSLVFSCVPTAWPLSDLYYDVATHFVIVSVILSLLKVGFFPTLTNIYRLETHRVATGVCVGVCVALPWPCVIVLTFSPADEWTLSGHKDTSYNVWCPFVNWHLSPSVFLSHAQDIFMIHHNPEQDKAVNVPDRVLVLPLCKCLKMFCWFKSSQCFHAWTSLKKLNSVIFMHFMHSHYPMPYTSIWLLLFSSYKESFGRKPFFGKTFCIHTNLTNKIHV